MKTLEMLSVKGLIFISFYFFTLIQKSASVSYTIGSYPDYLKYGINDPNCGATQMDRIYFEIDFSDRKCFRNSYPPEILLFKNEDIFQERKIKARLLGGIVPIHSDAPWAVNIFYSGDDTICEGVLVTLEWVLTVARCNPKNETNRQIYGGSRMFKSGVERAPVLWQPAHKWRRQLFDWDLALVKLNTPYTRTHVKNYYTLNTVCLPKRDSGNPMPENATFFSWGDIDEKRSRTIYLRRADILLRASNNCKHKHLLCADFVKGSDSPRPCYGDRGGGLVQYEDSLRIERAILAGIFLLTEEDIHSVQHHHQPCNKDITYSEFYRISDIIDWILETISTNNSTIFE